MVAAHLSSNETGSLENRVGVVKTIERYGSRLPSSIMVLDIVIRDSSPCINRTDGLLTQMAVEAMVRIVIEGPSFPCQVMVTSPNVEIRVPRVSPSPTKTVVMALTAVMIRPGTNTNAKAIHPFHTVERRIR